MNSRRTNLRPSPAYPYAEYLTGGCQSDDHRYRSVQSLQSPGIALGITISKNHDLLQQVQDYFIGMGMGGINVMSSTAVLAAFKHWAALAGCLAVLSASQPGLYAGLHSAAHAGHYANRLKARFSCCWIVAISTWKSRQPISSCGKPASPSAEILKARVTLGLRG